MGSSVLPVIVCCAWLQIGPFALTISLSDHKVIEWSGYMNSVCWAPGICRLAAMREDSRNYSLPTVHERAFDYETEKAKSDSSKPEATGSIPVLYEEIRYFRNEVGSRPCLISRRHSYMTIHSRKDFEGRVRSYSYNPQVSLYHGLVSLVEDAT